MTNTSSKVFLDKAQSLPQSGALLMSNDGLGYESSLGLSTLGLCDWEGWVNKLASLLFLASFIFAS
jgi:hypothetical protein